MKKLTILSFTLLFAFTIKADVLTVSNIPTSGAMYLTIQEAIDVASSGDTILVHSSPTAYEGCTIDKALVIAGQGSLGAAGGTGTIIDADFILNPGSSNTVITGFYFNEQVKTGSSSTAVNLNNIKIANNYFDRVYNAIELDVDQDIICHNVLIEGNIFRGPATGSSSCIDSDIDNTGIVIKNNIFQTYASQDANRVANELNSTCIFDHNIVIVDYRDIFSSCNGVTVTNNVFYVINDTLILSSEMPGGIFNNNVTFGATEPLGGTNVHADPMFANFPDDEAWSATNDMNITNPALQTIASDGGVPGVYGADFPFSRRNLPSGFPHIDLLTVPKMNVSQGGDVQIRIQGARSGIAE